MRNVINLVTINVMNRIAKFKNDEDGASLVEYAVLLGILLLVTVAAISLLGTTVSKIFANTNTLISGN